MNPESDSTRPPLPAPTDLDRQPGTPAEAPHITPISTSTLPPRASVDPWAHRRGEPRVFAFLWTMYILLAVGGSLLWVTRFAVVSAGSFSPAARIMLVVVAVGAMILWPMVRLSQASPQRDAVGHILVDAIIVLTPIQLVLWPLMTLAGWPFQIVLALAALLAAWVTFAGGLLACALAGPHATQPNDPAIAGRTCWMLVIVACVVAGPLMSFSLRATHTASPSWLPMLSPLTAIPHLTGVGISGPQTPATGAEYRFIAATAGLGSILWVAAFVRSALGKRAHPA